MYFKVNAPVKQPWGLAMNQARQQPDLFYKKLVIAAIFIVCSLTLTAEPADQPKIDEAKKIVTIAENEIDAKDVYFDLNDGKEITSPRCVYLAQLIRQTQQFRDIQKNQYAHDDAKYWILISQANELAHKAITRFAKANKLAFICERRILFAVLRKQKEFEKFTDQQLTTEFDLTNQLIKFFKENK